LLEQAFAQYRDRIREERKEREEERKMKTEKSL